MDWGTPAVVLMFIATFVAPPGTLAEAARREAWRRQASSHAARTLTTSDLPRSIQPEPVQPPPGADSTVAPVPPPAAAVPAVPPRPVEDEAWWRDRMATARAAIERDQVLTDAMQSRINALTTDVASRDDPRQRALLVEQRQRALVELDRLKAQIVRDRQAVADIEEDARRKGVPAGWIR